MNLTQSLCPNAVRRRDSDQIVAGGIQDRLQFLDGLSPFLDVEVFLSLAEAEGRRFALAEESHGGGILTANHRREGQGWN